MALPVGFLKALIILITELMLKFPEILDWVNDLRDDGKTEVTDVEWDALANKWSIPSDQFFQ